MKKPVLKTPQQFYDFFAAIPESRWTMGRTEQMGKRCAEGHLNHHFASNSGSECQEVKQLEYLFQPLVGTERYPVVAINDRWIKSFKEPTPRRRILGALRKLMRGEGK